MSDHIRGTPFGLRDGTLLHVDDVPRGAACGCVCPACGGELVARKGDKNAHHFAHVDGDCGAGRETALHMFAKQVIAAAAELLLPAAAVRFGHTRRVWELFSQQTVRADEVRLESRLGRIVPDVVMRAGKRYLLVEVCVSHAVDDTKLAAIRARGLSALEITLGHLPPHLPQTELRDEILYDPSNRQWLYNSKAEARSIRLKKHARRLRHRHSHLDLHVSECPKKVRAGAASVVADVVAECRNCEYCLDDGVSLGDTGSTLCLGHIPAFCYDELP